MASYCVRDLNWETMEPKKFVPELIAGIRTKPFFHNAEKMIPKASDSLYENATKLAKKDMGGAHQEVQELTVKYSEISCVPVLIPVWMATSSCNGKPVWFCMNGMSGKYIARSPAPKKNQIWTLGIILTILYVWLAGYLQYTSGIINFGTVIISAVFAIFSVASIMAGLKKVFSMKLSIWLAIGVDLFYLFISLRHFKTMIWYHFAIFGFIGLVFLLWRLSSSGAVDESEYEESDLTKLE
jgi:hypothetical protein